MNKRGGLIGKIFLGIIVVIILVLVFIGFSAYQAYSSYKEIKTGVTEITSEIREVLGTKNCSKIDDINEKKEKVFSEIDSVCANPLLKWGIKKIKAIPLKCESKTEFKEDINLELNNFAELCNGNNLNVSDEFDESEIDLLIEENKAEVIELD